MGKNNKGKDYIFYDNGNEYILVKRGQKAWQGLKYKEGITNLVSNYPNIVQMMPPPGPSYFPSRKVDRWRQNPERGLLWDRFGIHVPAGMIMMGFIAAGHAIGELALGAAISALFSFFIWRYETEEDVMIGDGSYRDYFGMLAGMLLVSIPYLLILMIR